MSAPRAVVFLGNPGREYAQTRHNAGFQLADQWTSGLGLSWQTKFNGFWTSLREGSATVHLLKPSTFMNLSGQSVAALLTFFKIELKDLLVCHDEIELAWGEVRRQVDGGLAGHNGLRSIAQALGSKAFFRLRIGIGRPARGDVASFVLGRWTADEEARLHEIWDTATRELDAWVREGTA